MAFLESVNLSMLTEKAAVPLPLDVLGSLAEKTHRHLLLPSSGSVIHPVAQTLWIRGRKYAH